MIKGKQTISKKDTRKLKVLFGLIDHYLASGKPVGSETLKNEGFEDVSSATIRNYLSSLDEEGLLEQAHTSGGRTPTPKALKLYAKEFTNQDKLGDKEREELRELTEWDAREIASFMQKSAELLSKISGLAVFLSTPRFDHDFISKIKLVAIDAIRLLCVIVTDFGVVETEIIHVESKTSSFSLKRMEEYFFFRLSGTGSGPKLSEEEKKVAETIYHEVMVRYIVGYSHFTDEEIYKTGFARLLNYPELHQPKVLASTLALFENIHATRKLIRETMAKEELTFKIGEDLAPLSEQPPNCSVILIPYKIHQQVAGAIGIAGPMRLDYKRLFALLHHFSELMSRVLTDAIYKYKIQYRQPERKGPVLLESPQLKMIEQQGTP